VIEDTYLMGADYFQTPAKLEEDHKLGIPNVGVGKNSYISRAIIDKNARIGENVRIKPHPPGENFSGPGFTVINGITVVEKDAVIADGMEI
jgi:glucose-1-phosphate adenylyltransferase